jgi:hypothetical protein
MSTKRCAHCKIAKPLEEYAFNNKLLGTRQKHCRECMKKFNRQSYERRSDERKQEVKEGRQQKIQEAQQYIWDYLSTHPCADCGESNPVVLEFDHVRGRKKAAISDMPRQGYSISAIRAEISKCVVRCANCHRKKTHKERGWFSG